MQKNCERACDTEIDVDKREGTAALIRPELTYR